MSITTELQRISQAKANLKTTIEAREVTIDDSATIDTYASKVDEVYTKGYEKGKSEGGGDSYYDTFWDSCQDYGNRTDYISGFSGKSWNDTTFAPKYDIKPTMSNDMFSRCNITDLPALLDKQGVTLDFSKTGSMDYCFYSSRITKLGIIDMTNISYSTGARSIFSTSALKSIEKVIGSTKMAYSFHSSAFTGATNLEEVTFGGVIRGDLNLANCPLNLASMKSAIEHLSNYTGTTDELEYTVTFKATCWEALDAEGATSPNGNTWREYVNDLCWNVG